MISFLSKSALLAALLWVAMENPAAAYTSRTWLAVPVDNNWNNDSNWSGGSAPDTISEGAVFATSTILNPTFTADTVFGGGSFIFTGTGIVFQPGADAFVIAINGHTVQVNNGIVNNSSVAETINNDGANGLLVLAGGSIDGPVTIINSGANTETRFINGIQGGIVRLINANPTAAFHFFLGGGSSITVGSIEGNGSITLDGTFVSVGSNNLSTVFSGVISDGSQPGGSLTKIGTGSLVLSGINTYTGNTTVSSGALYINGSIASPLTTVNQAGLLGGTGVIGGGVLNRGIVSPGMSPGKLTIQGDYTQTGSGVLRVEVAGAKAGQFDQLSVQGAASLNGGLQIVKVGKPKLERGDRLTIVTANGGVVGRFSEIDSGFGTNTILTLDVVYESNAVLLESTQGSFEQFARQQHLSPNEISVAEALDSAATDPRADKLFQFLDRRNLSKLAGDFDRIAPEELTSVFGIGVALANVQSGNIQRRNEDIRSGTRGFSAAGLGVNGSSPSYSGSFSFGSGMAGPNGNDDGKEVKETKQEIPEENRWGAFLSGTGEWVSVGNTDNARGYDLTSGGFTLGIDYKVTPNFAIGLAAGYTGTTADLVDRGRVYVNGGKIGLYATFFQNEQAAQAPTTSKDSSKDSSKEAPAPAPSIAKGFYADMAVFGGYNSYDTRRSALQGEARGDTDGGELNALFGAGYDFKKGGFTFGPTASFNYTYIGTNEFTEHGSLAPLNIHGGKGESLRTAFGLKASYDWKIGGILIQPEIRAAWQHEYGDAAYALDASFANGAGNSFLVNGPQLGRDSALLGAGFAIQCSERCSTYFYYDGELGRKNYESNSVTGGLRVTF